MGCCILSESQEHEPMKHYNSSSDVLGSAACASAAAAMSAAALADVLLPGGELPLRRVVEPGLDAAAAPESVRECVKVR